MRAVARKRGLDGAAYPTSDCAYRLINCMAVNSRVKDHAVCHGVSAICGPTRQHVAIELISTAVRDHLR